MNHSATLQKNRSVTLGKIFFLSGFLISSLFAEDVTIIQDRFKITAERKEYTSIDGTKTEVGDATWSSSPSSDVGVIISGKEGVTVGDVESAGASLPIPERGIICLEADIKPMGSDWTGIGFGGDHWDDKFHTPMAGGQIFVTARSSGDYNILGGVKPDAPKLAEGRIETLRTNQATHFEMILDQEANKLTVKINGHIVLDNIDLGEKSVRLRIKRAGIHFNAPATARKPNVDNFKITITKP
ncbi:MAG: hypothetical protein V4507_16870 [Verrucomicrobiota bacterium]